MEEIMDEERRVALQKKQDWRQIFVEAFKKHNIIN